MIAAQMFKKIPHNLPNRKVN